MYCRVLVSLILALAMVASSWGHVVPKDNHDRTLVIHLTPEGVWIDYRLELDEAQAALDLSRADVKGAQSRQEFAARYASLTGTRLARRLILELDGQQIPFTCTRQTHRLLDHLRCDFHFEAKWKPTLERSHTFAFREGNYPDDDFSKLHLHVVAGFGVHLESLQAPSQVLMNLPGTSRGPGDTTRLRQVRGVFVLGREDQKGILRPALIPDLAPYRSPPGLRNTGPLAALRKPPPAGLVVASGRQGPPPNTPAPAAPAASPSHTLLALLLDTRLGMGLLLLLAVAFGAVHALTPGHGKTLVAAYLVGERGTIWHALLLGLTTTLTHTAAVILLAALLPLFFPDHIPPGVQMGLGLLGGLLVAGLGLWLLLQRLTGRADHIHIGGGHHHHHHHTHPHIHTHDHDAESGERPGWWALVVLGISGGIVPCWDAIAMLCFAISAQRLWLGLPLLLAFSAGLAGVLVAIGIGVVYARKYASSRWGETGQWSKLFKSLPLISAILVTVLGLWLCYDSIRAVNHVPPPASTEMTR